MELWKLPLPDPPYHFTKGPFTATDFTQGIMSTIKRKITSHIKDSDYSLKKQKKYQNLDKAEILELVDWELKTTMICKKQLKF